MKRVILLVLLCGACSGDDPASEPDAADSGGASGATAQASSTNAGTVAIPSTPVATMTATRTPPVMRAQPSAAAPVAGSGSTTTVTPPAAGTPLCDVLARCCPALTDPTLRSTCEGVATSRAENACAQITPMLCGGTTPTTTSDPTCETLATCCASLDEEDAEDCQAVVDEADPAACGDTQAELCPATTTTPGSTGEECPKLMICCMTLTDDEDQEDCTDVVADADAAACAESLTELCPDPNAPTPPESDD